LTKIPKEARRSINKMGETQKIFVARGVKGKEKNAKRTFRAWPSAGGKKNRG